MTSAIPDTNVLLALAWPNHQFHAQARAWFAGFEGTWLTCAVTQLGFVRISSNPSFTRHAKTPNEATLVLRSMVAHPRHVFVKGDPSLAADPFQSLAKRLQGHQQVTDAYLVFLASETNAHVVTFDHRLSVISLEADWVRVLPV